LNFLYRFSKNNQISKFLNICLVGAELFHEDRRTDGQPDMTKLVVAFHNFANVLKNWGKGRQTEPQSEMSSIAKLEETQT
jgi:hypothetical protein